MTDLFEYLLARPYPGRGIMLGTTPSGKTAAAYFIMGRSENSRNRVFEKTEDGIRTRAHDEAKMTDPSLIIYHPVRRTERGRAALAAWSLTRAPLRRIHAMNAAAQFAHSMATLLAAGLPLPRALEVTANVVSNYTFSLAVRQVRQDVERGRPMAESMAGIECFPAMLTEMVGVGERSGALEETLDVIGGYYDNEVSVTTARLLAVLEPAITIALAVLVVILLLAVYLPMFTLYGRI